MAGIPEDVSSKELPLSIARPQAAEKAECRGFLSLLEILCLEDLLMFEEAAVMA